MPLPVAQPLRALVEEFAGAAEVVRGQLPVGQGDPVEVRVLLLALQCVGQVTLGLGLGTRVPSRSGSCWSPAPPPPPATARPTADPVATARRLRRANLRKRYHADGGHASHRLVVQVALRRPAAKPLADS